MFVYEMELRQRFDVFAVAVFFPFLLFFLFIFNIKIILKWSSFGVEQRNMWSKEFPLSFIANFVFVETNFHFKRFDTTRNGGPKKNRWVLAALLEPNALPFCRNHFQIDMFEWATTRASDAVILIVKHAEMIHIRTEKNKFWSQKKNVCFDGLRLYADK